MTRTMINGERNCDFYLFVIGFISDIRCSRFICFEIWFLLFLIWETSVHESRDFCILKYKAGNSIACMYIYKVSPVETELVLLYLVCSKIRSMNFNMRKPIQNKLLTKKIYIFMEYDIFYYIEYNISLYIYSIYIHHSIKSTNNIFVFSIFVKTLKHSFQFVFILTFR